MKGNMFEGVANWRKAAFIAVVFGAAIFSGLVSATFLEIWRIAHNRFVDGVLPFLAVVLPAIPFIIKFREPR